MLNWIGLGPSQHESFMKQTPPVLNCSPFPSTARTKVRSVQIVTRILWDYENLWPDTQKLLKAKSWCKFDDQREAGDSWSVSCNPSAPEAIWKLKVCTQGQSTGEMCWHLQAMQNNCTDCTFGRNMLGTAGKHSYFIFIIWKQPFQEWLCTVFLRAIWTGKGMCSLPCFWGCQFTLKSPNILSPLVSQYEQCHIIPTSSFSFNS